MMKYKRTLNFVFGSTTAVLPLFDFVHDNKNMLEQEPRLKDNNVDRDYVNMINLSSILRSLMSKSDITTRTKKGPFSATIMGTIFVYGSR